MAEHATDLTAAFQADLADLRGQVGSALDRSIGSCARCKVCDAQVNAAMAVIGAELDRLHSALEHAASAAAGSHEGIRLWMLDCGELVAKHRARAAAAEAERDRAREAAASDRGRAKAAEADRAALRDLCRSKARTLAVEDVLRIIGSEEGSDA